MINNTAILNSAVLRSFVQNRKFNFKILWVLSFAAIISLLFIYIFQIQEATKASFRITAFEKELAGLSRLNQSLEADLFQTSYPANLEDILLASQYEKIGKIHYINILENQVVVK